MRYDEVQNMNWPYFIFLIERPLRAEIIYCVLDEVWENNNDDVSRRYKFMTCKLGTKSLKDVGVYEAGQVNSKKSCIIGKM